MKALFTRIEEELGGLDILVNNAATNPCFGLAIDAPESTIDKTIDVNLKGFYVMMQMAARLMKKRGGGSIINISSIAGLRPGMNEVTYAMTKAGIISLSKGFAKELGPDNIRVNVIVPGLVETSFSKALIDNEEKKNVRDQSHPPATLWQPQ